MTLFSRVATVAAMTLSLAGLVATTPGWANGIDQSLIATPALATLNTLAPHVVPANQGVLVDGQPLTVETASPAAAADQVIAPAVALQGDDDDDFGTLAEAVAAQGDANSPDQATRCLAGAIYFEAKGEPLSGQLAVAQVILNRAKSGRFPPDVCGVVTQRGQFGFVRGGRIPSINENGTPWHTAVAVARVALADVWDSPAEEALYFNTNDRRPASNIRRIAAIGNHVFYR
ncbi:cell wall hydrolase [Sphingomonas sp. KR1UV-12]|uniref:Cell wall hydrolase n=1 Tax=Sphingomonas aurea TaxID=3063994 RepID=A0ABT9ELL4_9SPHN|nr:cell wall hydrolase [Sphingomonas sp. KR1UV-12]MDP1027829.1 cell wall hydrolase [Sphingomonas sp. KR1UV-12]